MLVTWRLQAAATVALTLVVSTHATAADYSRTMSSVTARAAVEAMGKGGASVPSLVGSRLNSTLVAGPREFSYARDTAKGKYNIKLQLDGLPKEWWTPLGLQYDERGSSLRISSPNLSKTVVFPCIYGACGPAVHVGLQANASFPMVFGTAQPRIELKGEAGLGAGCGWNCFARITGMIQLWGNVRLEPSFSTRALDAKATAYIGPQLKIEALCLAKFSWNYQYRLAEKTYYRKYF